MKRALAITLLCIMTCATALLPARASIIDRIDTGGKLDPLLTEKFELMDDTETVPIYVWLRDVDSDAVMKSFKQTHLKEYVAYTNATKSTDEILHYNADMKYKDGESTLRGNDSPEEVKLLQDAIELKRAEYRTAYQIQNNSILNKHVKTKDSITFVSSYAPMAIIDANKATIKSFMHDDDVVWMELFMDVELTPQLGLANSITRTDYVRDTYGNKGAGVKIGMLESYVPSKSDEDLSGASITTNTTHGNSEPANLRHATAVAKILVGASNGIVPDAQLYCACQHNYVTYYNSMEWLISQGVNIINLSIGTNEFQGTYNILERWTDHIAVQHNVHVVAAAGNSADYVETPGMSYNVITVGGYDDNDYGFSNQKQHTLYEIGDNQGTSYKEDDSSDRPEKPNLVAAAVGVNGSTGTSFATPQVTGVIAQMCGYNTSLKTKQSIVGAIMAASSAIKVEGLSDTGLQGDTFISSRRIESNPQISEKEGAGKLDARWARGIVSRGNFFVVNTASFPYMTTISIDATENSLTRVAIFYLKRNTVSSHTSGTTSVERNIPDLNLIVFSPTISHMGASTTQYSNFEIVQFVPEESGEYIIRINAAETVTDTQYIGVAIW